MGLASGSRLGAYEIVSLLGAGGMGEVYRAHDARLQRDVAIKILPEAVAADAERLARFEREAQALAALNHPHIAQIYGVEGAVGQPHTALVMELVEGETLAERLTRGPIPLADALDVARQIADALAAAHEVGIIHRDLKPANIRIRPDGTVKLLDFGLARTIAPAAGSGTYLHDATISPTITSPALATGIGTLLGTAVYMAPEQAKGRAADRRADVWAFGCVLYEMLTGRRAFDGEGVTETLASVLLKDPDWAALPAEVPAQVRRLLQRCLRKDVRHRLQDIGDARLELEEPVPDVTPATAARPRWHTRAAAALIAGAVLGAVGGWLVSRSAPAVARPTRFELVLPTVESAVLSPDASMLVIASQRKLSVRELRSVDLRPLAGTDGAIRPFWSPDGAMIAYGAGGKLWKIPAAGGAAVAICDLANGLWDDDASGAWLEDGTIVFSDGNTALFRVPAEGGDPVVMLKPDPATELHFHSLAGLPGGHGVIYVVHRGGTVQATDTIGIWSEGKGRVLLQVPGQDIENPVYSPSGYVLFDRSPTNAGVWAVPFSLSSGTTTGEPFLVAARRRQPSVAGDGTLVTLPPRQQRRLDLALVGRDGVVQSRIDEPRLRAANATLSPDGARIAVAESTDDKADVWIYDVARGARQRATRDGTVANLAWSADGRSLFYDVRLAARNGVQIKRATADGSERTEDVVEGRQPAAARDGRTLFYVEQGADGLRLWYRSLVDPQAKAVPFIDQAFYSMQAAPSPDGRFVAYAAAPGPGPTEVYLRRFPPSEGAWQVSTSGGTSPRWSSDGRLFFARAGDIYEVTVTTSPDVRVSPPLKLFTRTTPSGAVPQAFDVSADGKRFLISTPTAEAGEARVVVALNWLADVKR